MDLIKCGENLKKARKNKGLTQKAFAERLGQKPSYSTNVYYWETGKQPVPKEHREKVTHELGIAEFEFVPTIGYVYLFYYPDAESEEDNIYPCKIGSTRQSVEHRIRFQMDEWGRDEMPKIPLKLPVPIDECEAWEKIIHRVLTLHDRWINKAEAEQKGLKGKEWFYTSSDEVRSIYESLRNRIRHLIKPSLSTLHQNETQ